MDHEYGLHTVIDNVCLPGPWRLPGSVPWWSGRGTGYLEKILDESLRGHCDSFCVETDIHYPADPGLVWDAMRCTVR